MWEASKSNEKLNDIESDQYHLYTFSNRGKNNKPNENVWA